MKVNKITELLLVCSIFAIIVGCSTTNQENDYSRDFIFTGTIQEILREEEMLVMKEYGGEDKGRREGNIYEIPVNNSEQYEVGEKLKITVYSNIPEDIWDLDHMRFEIEKIEN